MPSSPSDRRGAGMIMGIVPSCTGAVIFALYPTVAPNKVPSVASRLYECGFLPTSFLLVSSGFSLSYVVELLEFFGLIT